MPTPEEVLEDVMRLKWPDGIREEAYGLVVSTVMGFADLLRLPGEKPRAKRMRKAVEVNQKLEPHKEPIKGKGLAQERLRDALMRGPLTIKEALEVTGHSVNSTTYASLQRIGAKPFIGPDGIKRWTLPGSGIPTPRKVARRAPAQEQFRKAVAKALAPGLPVNLGKLRGELGCSKDVILKVVREMGAKQSGVGPHTRWTLPLPKHVNGIKQVEMEVSA